MENQMTKTTTKSQKKPTEYVEKYKYVDRRADFTTAQLEEIEHRTTRVRRPQSNGFVERLHRTLLDEHFRIQGRTKWYEALDEMQTDLDDYLVTYNTKRPHQGRNMKGMTPYTVFKKGLPKTLKKEARKTTENTA